MPRGPRARPSNPDTIEKKQERLRKRYSQDTTTLYEDMVEKYHHDPTSDRPMYWYIFGYTDLAKPVFLGPEMSEGEADRRADDAGLHDVRIKTYRTRNLAKASRQMKAELIEEMNADQALARMKHKLPERK